MSQRKIPKYRWHRASGRAVVTIGGKDVYLGVYDSPESRKLYDQKIAEWLASGRSEPLPPVAAITVAEMAARYLRFAATWYVKNGEPTKQLERVERSCGVAVKLYGATAAAEFGPLRLKAVRQRMIDLDWTRTHINHCVGCVVQGFKWAVAEELIPSSVIHGLGAVGWLQRGRCAAREGEPVLPAHEESVAAVQAEVSAQVRDMIDMQLLTGMRPGELVKLSPNVIDRTGRVDLGYGSISMAGVWVYVPGTHKTEHHQRRRIILIGPKAQKVLTPYLFRDPSAPCFSPLEAETARLGDALNNGRRRSRRIGTAYTVSGYRRAIDYAVKRLDRRRRKWHPPLVEAPAVVSWFPHQLRHNCATRLVAQFGWDVARILLGHSSVEMTRIYAENDWQKAADAARKAG